MGIDFCHCAGIDQRADIRRCDGSRADAKRLHRNLQFLGEALVDRCLDIYPVGTHAGLAAIAEFAPHQSRHRSVDVCIGKDDKRRVATQFQGQPLQRVR